MLPAQPSTQVELRFANLAPGTYRLSIRRTGFKANDAHTRYLGWGSPRTLTPSQIGELQGLTRDLPEVSLVRIAKAGTHVLRLPMRGNDVVLAILEPAPAGKRR